MGTGSSEVTPLERQQLLVVQRATFWHRVRFGFVRRALRRTGASTVVDIGAGSGVLGQWLRSARPDVEYRYAESSPHLAAGLRERFGSATEVRIGDPLPVRSVVAMLDVIEHIDDDIAALRAVARSMDGSSLLVVTVPALPSLFSPWDTALGHHRRYTRRSLRTALESAGFHIERVHYLFPELLPIALWRRVRASEDGSADFPALPTWVDRVGGLVSGMSAGASRVWPAGTSLVAVASTGGRR
jgi:hypothetical protein